MAPTLNDLERQLDPARFLRVSRAALINLNAVTEVIPLPGGLGEILLKTARSWRSPAAASASSSNPSRESIKRRGEE
jgi:DNA-binding LytR/AlgR family response regulator